MFAQSVCRIAFSCRSCPGGASFCKKTIHMTIRMFSIDLAQKACGSSVPSWYRTSASVSTAAVTSTRTWRCVIRRRWTRAAVTRRAATWRTTPATACQRCRHTPASTRPSTLPCSGFWCRCRQRENSCLASKITSRKRYLHKISCESYIE